MTIVGHVFCPLGTLLVPLFGNFITDAPHHDRRVVAMSAYKVFEVLAPPLVVKQVVAVFHFGFFPCVETLGHHHHTHRVAHLHLHLRRHVVGGTNGIYAHILHQTYLTNDGCLVNGCTQRA